MKPWGWVKTIEQRLVELEIQDSNITDWRITIHPITERCKLATPLEWVRYVITTRVTKTIRDEEPEPLFDLLSQNYFEESSWSQVGFFFVNSKTLLGKQSIQNRLLFMCYMTDPWNNKYQRPSNDQIREIGKKSITQKN